MNIPFSTIHNLPKLSTHAAADGSAKETRETWQIQQIRHCSKDGTEIY